MSTTFHINIDGSIGGRTRVQHGSTGGGGGGGGGSRSASPRRGSFVRSASGTQALLEQLPPFVRKWYVRYIANGRKRWSAEEVLELEGAPSKVIQRLTGAPTAAAAHPHHHQPTGHQEQHQQQRRPSDDYNGDGSGDAYYKPERDNYPQVDDVKTNWTDLFFWAVLADERLIAQHLWLRTSEPMRFAIWAAHVAQFTSLQQINATRKETWEEAAATYEGWAIEVLDQEKDAEVAARQLTFTSGEQHTGIHLPSSSRSLPPSPPCLTPSLPQTVLTDLCWIKRSLWIIMERGRAVPSSHTRTVWMSLRDTSTETTQVCKHERAATHAYHPASLTTFTSLLTTQAHDAALTRDTPHGREYSHT